MNVFNIDNELVISCQSNLLPYPSVEGCAQY